MKAVTVDSFSLKQRSESLSRKFGLYLESLLFESFILFLVLVHLLCITTELLIKAGVIRGQYSTVSLDPTSGKTRDYSSLNSTTDPGLTQSSNSPLTTDPAVSQSSNSVVTTDPVLSESSISLVTNIVHYLSLTIVSLFMIEILLRAALNKRHFLIHPLNIIDCVVVMVAFTLEIVYTFHSIYCMHCEAVTYIVALRLVKLPHVCNIQARKYKESMNETVNRYDVWKRKSEEYNRILNHKLDAQHKEIKRLESLLNKSQQSTCSSSVYQSRSLPDIADTGLEEHSISVPSPAMVVPSVLTHEGYTSHLPPSHELSGTHSSYRSKFTVPNDDYRQRRKSLSSPQVRRNSLQEETIFEEPQMLSDLKRFQAQHITESSFDNSAYNNDEENEAPGTWTPHSNLTGETYTNQDGIPTTDL